MSTSNPFAEMLDDLAAKFQPTEKTPLIPSECLGWTVGESRSYHFYGVEVNAQYRGYEDGITMMATCCGHTVRTQLFSESGAEDFAQELAARVVLEALRGGFAVMVEARR